MMDFCVLLRNPPRLVPAHRAFHVASSAVDKKDTLGFIKGPVTATEDTSAMSASGGIQIKDQAGDSIWFSFSYSEVPNLNIKKIVTGNCVEINYHAVITREEGIESSRIFFIKSIKF